MKQSAKLVGKYIVLIKNAGGTKEIISTLLVDIMLRRRMTTSGPVLSKLGSRKLNVGLLKQGPKPPMIMVVMRRLP